MTNITLKVTKSEKLVLIMDLREKHGFTKTGQHVKVASSDGNVALWMAGAPRSDGMCFNLNLYRKRDP